MVYPPPLQPGDRIKIVSVAGNISREPVEKARKLLEEEHFVVETGIHTFDTFHMFAGTDADRASDMQLALDDPGVRAIIFSRGGYGSLRTLMRLDWTGFFRNPKWLVGFSDITVFHSFLTKNRIASIHGVMPAFFFEDGARTDSYDRLLDLLKGNGQEYRIPAHGLNRTGVCSGELIGGNLSLLMSLRGTSLDMTTEGKVLFIEDIHEFDYHVDRMMMNLQFGGLLAGLAGLVVGYFTDTRTLNEPFGLDELEIIRQVVAEYDYPVVFGFPAGHELPNYPLLFGSKIGLEVSPEGVLFRQPYTGQ